MNLAIIGGGPAGYTAAAKAGKAGLSVVLFEKNMIGGVCLNEGCIPTKTLLYSAKILDSARTAAKYGISVSDPSFDLGKIMSRKQKVLRKLSLGIKAKLSAAGVKVVSGEAFIQDSSAIVCNGETYNFDRLIVCAGSKTFIPDFCGMSDVECWTHADALSCKELPKSLVIVGGGVIGIEFASFFNSLGVKVTVVEMASEILASVDSEVAAMLRSDYSKRGVNFLLGARVLGLHSSASGIVVDCQNAGGQISVSGEKVLISVGRKPAVEGYGLENLRLQLTDRRTIKVDSHMQTSVPGVYVCGDLSGVSLLAHTAVREAEVAVNHILGIPDEMSYVAIPSVVYTNPEVASVGASEDVLCKDGACPPRQYRVVKLPLSYSGRFVSENEGTAGFIKALVGSDGKLLGVHIYGNPASEIISVASMMIQDGRSLSEFHRYVFPHPTVSEIFNEL